jgi:acyl carrier protein
MPRAGSREPTNIVAPRTGTDLVATSLAVTLGALLGIRAVSPDTPLTALEADALTFVRLSAAISRDHGVEVPISALFAADTLTRIAALIRDAAPSDRPALAVTDAWPTRGDVFDGASVTSALSGQQQQIWVLHHLSHQAGAYTSTTVRAVPIRAPPEPARSEVAASALSWRPKRENT